MSGENLDQRIPDCADDSAGEYGKEEQIRRIKLLYRILDHFKGEENQYPLSIVLRMGTDFGYEENQIFLEILSFRRNGYMRLETEDGADQTEVDELLKEEIYDKVLVRLNYGVYGILFDNSIKLNEKITELETRCGKDEEALERLNDNWKEYCASRDRIDQIKSEIEAQITEFNGQRGELNQTITDSEKKWVDDRKDFEKAMITQAENTALEAIEKELKLSGRIGKEMQNMQKDIIQFMVIFITIFTMIGIDIRNLDKWTMPVMLRANLILCSTMSTLMTLVSVIMAPSKIRTYVMSGLSVMLWLIVLASFCLS